MISGIYSIENIVNGKKYIGQSVNLEKRIYEHFSFLKNNNHYNFHLQRAYNKYIENAFISRILIYCEPFELTKYEQFFVDFYTPETLYNICLECVDSTRGIKFSEESRKLMSLHHPDISGENNPNFGKDFSGENNPRTKLTQENVNWIREHRKEYSLKELGKIFNISKDTVKEIYRGRTWKDNTYHPVHIEKNQSGENNPNAKLKQKDVRWIREHKKEYTLKELSKMFETSTSNIGKICQNIGWKEI